LTEICRAKTGKREMVTHKRTKVPSFRKGDGSVKDKERNEGKNPRRGKTDRGLHLAFGASAQNESKEEENKSISSMRPERRKGGTLN